MSFKRTGKDNAQPKLVWWPVTTQEPKDGGGATYHKVQVQYELLAESEKDQIITDGGDMAFLHRVVHDWRDFLEADGSAIACSQESRADFFEMSHVKAALVAGYFNAIFGGKRKNS